MTKGGRGAQPIAKNHYKRGEGVQTSQNTADITCEQYLTMLFNIFKYPSTIVCLYCQIYIHFLKVYFQVISKLLLYHQFVVRALSTAGTGAQRPQLQGVESALPTRGLIIPKEIIRKNIGFCEY